MNSGLRSFSAQRHFLNDVKINMKKPMCTKEDLFYAEEVLVSDKTDHIAQILDDKYKPVNLKEITSNLPQQTANKNGHISYY